MKKYFEVTAKAGHVGRHHYTEISLFIIAESKKDAAETAKWIPRVKHHDKTAILAVNEITFNEFNVGMTQISENPYFKAKNIQEQRALCHDIEVKSCNPADDKSIEIKTLKERNPRKYQKYCIPYCTEDYTHGYNIA